MNEKEKGLAGLLYNPNYDEYLGKERDCVKNLCLEYNNLHFNDRIAQNNIINKIVKKAGKNFLITAPFWCDYGYNIEFGDNFYTNHNCTMLDGASITFGDNVFIAPNCCFATATHPIDVGQRNQGLERSLPITVGNNVWIGAGVIVLAGVTIGDNTTIGAGSVVTKDIPSGVVAVGNPCRVLRNVDENDFQVD